MPHLLPADSPDKFSSNRLLFRSLTPSVLSVVGGILGSMTIIGVHLLLLTLHKGTFFTTLFGAQWIQGYTSIVTRPISNFLNNATLNTVLTAILWGLLGLIVYTGLEFAITSYSEWRSTEKEIRLGTDRTIVEHPLRRLLIIRGLWRSLISISVILLTVGAEPVFHYLLTNDSQVLSSKSGLVIAAKIGITILIWTVILHLYIILLRLFTFRTRVFGEIIR